MSAVPEVIDVHVHVDVSQLLHQVRVCPSLEGWPGVDLLSVARVTLYITTMLH